MQDRNGHIYITLVRLTYNGGHHGFSGLLTLLVLGRGCVLLVVLFLDLH